MNKKTLHLLRAWREAEFNIWKAKTRGKDTVEVYEASYFAFIAYQSECLLSMTLEEFNKIKHAELLIPPIEQPRFDTPLKFRDRYRKHFSQEFTLVAILDGKMREVFTARFYTTDPATVCIVWYMPDNQYHFVGESRQPGSGSGYNRRNAAIEDAMTKAGFLQVDGGIEPGDQLRSLAKTLGLKHEGIDFLIVNAHA